jgi:phenylpropionate dioxygenase-like ring-hydroxylating dioxygenase large terminal subunit
MLTKEENDLLTRIGPGTPGGEMMRRYWQPVALAEELPAGGAPLPIRLLGEDLVLFRGDAGRPGLLGVHCAHRGADLSYGRLEDGGLRCIYHGWLYDGSGRCLEQPGEPAGSTFHERIRQTAYPCVEHGGLILAYLGPGEPPLVPNYEFLAVPERQRSATKYFQECNYLQGNEGNFDPQHLSFLHRIFDHDAADFRQDLHAKDVSPRIEPVDTEFGMHLYALRDVGEGRTFAKVRSFVMPTLALVGSRGPEGYVVNWHVPIDDEHHWRYSLMFSRDPDADPAALRQDRGGAAENYVLKRNRSNRYVQDREEMKTQTFLGMGRNFTVHDTAATESEGPIYDRTQEHLGYTDRGIIALRKVMATAIRDVQEGRDPIHVVRETERNRYPDMLAIDEVIPPGVHWKDFWKDPSTSASVVAVGSSVR